MRATDNLSNKGGVGGKFKDGVGIVSEHTTLRCSCADGYHAGNIVTNLCSVDEMVEIQLQRHGQRPVP